MLAPIWQKIDQGADLNKDEIVTLLSLNDENDRNVLYEKAYKMKVNQVGDKVYFRGLIELSNVCEKNCYYCGIRKNNDQVKRYVMTDDEIIDSANWIFENNYGSLVLQSGEVATPHFIDFIERILKKVKADTQNQLRVTLSLGEQTEETYRRWLEAGAHRYLLRIETTNRELYGRLHPDDHDLDRRLRCLKTLRNVGYQVGTGVMIGLPGQTEADLADDVLFYKDQDIDMIGMGPYLPHGDTPMRALFPDFKLEEDRQLALGLNMIAVTRLVLKDVNIAATTALQTLHPEGRELGIQAGANVVMPNATDTSYRTAYQLYDNKPCLDENSSQCRGCLSNRIQNIGESVALNEWGDSLHFRKRMGESL